MAAAQRGNLGNTFSQRVEQLAAAVDGRIIRPEGDAGRGQEQPVLVLQCMGTKDVAAGVRFAHENGLPVWASSGEERVAGAGVVIDLSLMKGVKVDVRGRRARIQAGATIGDVDRATQRYALATPTGLPSTANAVSLALDGGVGWLRRKYGTARDNALTVEIVTADGRVEAAEAGKSALLGSKSAGIVTAMTLRLYPVGPEVVLLTAVYAFSLARAALYTWRDWTRTAPAEASTDFLFWNVPATPPFPRALHNRPVVIVAGVFAGKIQEGLRTFQPLRELSKPLIDLTGPTPYVAAQSTFDPFLPEGVRLDSVSRLLVPFNDETVESVLAAGVKRRPAHTLLALRHLGGTDGRGPHAYLVSATPGAGEDPMLRWSWDQLAAG